MFLSKHILGHVAGVRLFTQFSVSGLISWSFFAFLIFAFSTFAPALEAVHGRSQEEAGHDGSHGHRDARKDDDEEVCEGQGDLTFPETVLGELTERHTAAIGGQRALHTIYT